MYNWLVLAHPALSPTPSPLPFHGKVVHRETLRTSTLKKKNLSASVLSLWIIQESLLLMLSRLLSFFFLTFIFRSFFRSFRSQFGIKVCGLALLVLISQYFIPVLLLYTLCILSRKPIWNKVDDRAWSTLGAKSREIRRWRKKREHRPCYVYSKADRSMPIKRGNHAGLPFGRSRDELYPPTIDISFIKWNDLWAEREAVSVSIFFFYYL